MNCNCNCHAVDDGPKCCSKCYLQHGINFRTFKNHVEPAEEDLEPTLRYTGFDDPPSLR